MLQEGQDFYYNEDGLMVLTAAYHLKRGRCCGNGCVHCPFDYINVREPRRTELLTQKEQHLNQNTSTSTEEDYY